MSHPVRHIEPTDRGEWMRIRAVFWPRDPGYDDHEAEADRFFSEAQTKCAVLVVPTSSGGLCGFAELALRTEYVEGCDTKPVGYLEGIWVDPEARRGGVAAGLCAAAVEWCRAQGCTEMASDAEAHNADSIAWHASVGFEQVSTVVCFRREI
jgi:aminoglycoside 6'-N-acetyltransferase I